MPWRIRTHLLLSRDPIQICENPCRGALQAREIMQDMLRFLEIQRSRASIGITVSRQSTPSQHEPWHAQPIRIEASILQLPWGSGVFGKLVINKIYLFAIY